MSLFDLLLHTTYSIMRGRMASKALAKKNYESRVRSSPKGMQGNSRQGAAQWQIKHQYYSTFLQIHM